MAEPNVLCAKLGHNPPTPNPCCDGTPACAATYQRKAGSYTLCGMDELQDPSNPPRRYRTAAAGGSGFTQCWYTDPTCSTAKYGVGYKYTGAIRFGPDAFGDPCALDDTDLRPVNQPRAVPDPNSCDKGDDVPEAIIYELPGPLGPAQDRTYVQNRTSQTNSWGGTCGEGLSGQGVKNTGSVYFQLQDEDTDADAIARENGNIPAWTPCVDCSSYITTRGPGQFSANYSDLEVQIRAIDCPNPLQSYYATIEVLAKPYGSGQPFTLYSEIVHSFQGTPTGDYLSAWIKFPSAMGLEMRGGNCTITKQG